MSQNFWANIEEKIYALIPPLVLIYIFFQPFNHFAGVRSISFSLMLLFFLIKIIRRGIEIDRWDSTIVALFILLAAVLISIAFSNYKMDSLNAFRKNFLLQIVIFFVILNEFRTAEKLKSLLQTVVLSFISVTLVILIKNPPATLFNFLNIIEAKAHKETFLGGYALNAAFYVPFTIGYLLSMKDRMSIKIFFSIMLLAEFVLVWLYYSSRTTLAAILVSAVMVFLISKRYKTLAVMFAVVLATVSVSYFKKPELLERHKSLLSFQTYITRDGLSGRNYIWQGTFDMVKDSPIVGYGYGWKKIATVVREEGYLEKWKDKWPDTYDYFNKAGYGAANPHNLILQMLFEVGILGLAAFVLFWITVFIKVGKMMRMSSFSLQPSAFSPELNCFVKYGVVGVLITYSMTNITNGLWEETYGILTFMLAAIVLIVHDENRCKNR